MFLYQDISSFIIISHPYCTGYRPYNNRKNRLKKNLYNYKPSAVWMDGTDWLFECRTYIDGVALLGSFLSNSDHLPVQHPGVRQVDEELAVRPPHVQNTVGIIHRGDVRSLRSWRRFHLEIIATLTLFISYLHYISIKKKKRNSIIGTFWCENTDSSV